MVIDDDLTDRIRELLAIEPGVTEKRMFGGLAFLVDGKMAVAAGSEGGLLARVAADDYDRLAAADGVDDEVMGTKKMRGWLGVESQQLRSDHQLAEWVRRGVAVARSAPAKKPAKKRAKKSGADPR